MKPVLLSGLCLISTLIAPWAAAQEAPAGKHPAPSAWFKASEVAPDTWRIDDHGVANVYVVIGRTRALVVDTGCGAANLRDYVRSITPLPLLVLNTHGHPDHVGANYQFGAILAPEADFGAIRAMATPEQMKRFAGMLGGAVVPEGEVFHEAAVPLSLTAVKDGQVIDLGGRHLEVIATPGHTPGEIVVLDRDRKLLFTGDNDNGLVWLHLPESLPLDAYLASLEKVQARQSEFTTMLPGHGDPIDRDFVADEILCVKSILDGSATSEEYHSFVGKGRVAKVKRASVVFDPDKLRAGN